MGDSNTCAFNVKQITLKQNFQTFPKPVSPKRPTPSLSYSSRWLQVLGFSWHGSYYYDRCRPMGASSSCLLFESLRGSLVGYLLKIQCGGMSPHVRWFLLYWTKNANKCLQDINHYINLWRMWYSHKHGKNTFSYLSFNNLWNWGRFYCIRMQTTATKTFAQNFKGPFFKTAYDQV